MLRYPQTSIGITQGPARKHMQRNTHMLRPYKFLHHTSIVIFTLAIRNTFLDNRLITDLGKLQF